VPAMRIPVFPLPNTVFFPDTVLPLHVFESRYRALVEDALAGDRRFAVALARDDDERFHPTATVGRIENLQRLADGRFLLELHAEGRVQLRAAEETGPYFSATSTPKVERPEADPDAWTADTKRLLASHALLFREVAEEAGVEPLALPTHLTGREALHAVASTLPIPPAARQALLELDDLDERLARTSDALDETLRQVARFKAWSSLEPEGPPN